MGYFTVKRTVWSGVFLVAALFLVTQNVLAAGGLLRVSVQKSPPAPLAGVKVYLFNESGTYLGQNQITDSFGSAQFDVAEGTYKLRGDYLGYRFWSDATLVTADTDISITIPHRDLTITIAGDYQGAAEPLAGVPVYLFTEAGQYMGQKQTTGSSGQVVFSLPEQAYKVRADYLRQQFWSEVLTWQWQDGAVTVAMADAEVQVTGSGLPIAGVNVYAFSQSVAYLGLKGASDAGGTAAFRLPAGTYQFRADYQGSQYWSGDQTITASLLNRVDIDTGGGEFTFTVLKGTSDPLVGVKCYVFQEAGAYLGMTGVTDSQGQLTFNLADGHYKVRVDYLGYQFWSPVYTVPSELAATLTIAHRDVAITVQGNYPGTAPLAGVPVYLFSAGGAYMNQKQTTDANGQAAFNLPEQPYKVRADYLNQQFWSGDFAWQDTAVMVPLADAEIQVTGSGLPLGRVRVYAFSVPGAYLGQSGTTDAGGSVSFSLPAGAYKFRADYQGSQYWSAAETLAAGQVNAVEINTGGGEFTLTVLKGAGDPLAGVRCYVFSQADSFLGMADLTSSEGSVTFNLADGNYKFRVDYLGYQFWSPAYTVPAELAATLTIAHQDVAITVQGNYPETEPIAGVPVYLFTADGVYMNQKQTTDTAGQVVFSLPDQVYKVRADHRAQQYWSDRFRWQDAAVTVTQGEAQVQVTGGGLPLAGIKVYAFSAGGAYLGLAQMTDAGSMASFLLPAGAYKFRADYQGSQYWSAAETLAAGQVNPVDINTGGGEFTFTALKGASDPLAGVRCYVFSQAGIYLGMTDLTGSEGEVAFNLADGSYKLRVDYLGYRFWSDIFTMPDTLSASLIIAHQDVTITVEGDYIATEPIEGVPVYLFTSSGAYMGQKQTTDAGGQVIFNLPQQAYKARADYLGQQFWSDEFTWQDGSIPIQRGMANIHVVRNGTDVAGAKVYLFSEQGAYLGRYETTDASGDAGFLLPDRAFKFRANEGGDQQWSASIDIAAGGINTVEIDISPITVDIATDPDTIQEGGSSTLTWQSVGADACVIEPDIGPVTVNGSIPVSPAATTIYTITATGPGGTAADSVQVTVNVASEDVDYGLDYHEQQGGGGLVGETVRILNGNQIEARNDLDIASPNSLGLSFQAFYNSRSTHPGELGFGWSHTYSAYLETGAAGLAGDFIRLVDETGRARYFLNNGAGVFEGYFNERTHVKAESGKYVWYRPDGSCYGFSAEGKLAWIEDEKGNELSLIYNTQGLVETVTDLASARQLTFNYTAGLLDHIAGPITAAVADGIQASFEYDADSNLVSVTYADGSGFDYAYTDANDAHNLTEKRNKSNHLLTSWGYDAEDRCIAKYSVQGTGATIDYVDSARVEVTDAYGTLRTYTIGKISGRKRVTAMQGLAAAPYDRSNLVSWQYDASMNLTEVQTAGGIVHRYQNYDTRGNPATVILAAGSPEERIVTYSYHPEMNTVLTRSEPSVLGTGNKVTIFDYDDDYDAAANENPARLISRIIEQGFTRDAAGATLGYEYITTFTYNSRGQVLSIDGPLAGSEDTTRFAYDGSGVNLLAVNHPLIGATSFTNYDAAGRAGRLTDVNNRSQSLTYDGRGRVTAVTHEADGSMRTVSYNAIGLPDTATDEDGVAKTYDYDDDSRLSRIYDVDNNYFEHLYDLQGNLIERGRYDSMAVRTGLKRWYYQAHADFEGQQPDIPGKLWKTRLGERNATTYGYNADGLVSSVTNPNGNTTYYDYDAQNRLITVTRPAGSITSYDFDGHGNLASVVDGESGITSYTHDDMGRVVAATSPDSGTVGYVYDAAGNPVQKTDAKGTTVVYTYDTLNRLTGIQFPDANQDIGFSYDEGSDGAGRRTGMTDPAGATAYKYDNRGRLVGKTAGVDGVEYRLSRTYTPGNRLSSMNYPSGRSIDFSRYGTSQKIQQVTTTYNWQTRTLVDNLSYNPFGGPKGLDTGSGGAVSNKSGDCNCLEGINPGTMMEQNYSYDDNGNLFTISVPNTPWLEQRFDYDAQNRLVSAVGSYGTIGYTYDRVGNRTNRIINGQTDTHSYQPGTNRLEEISGPNPATFTYDANGNITAIDGQTLIYNQNNRLIRVEQGVDILGEYRYNGTGQRIVKEAAGFTTIYHYDFDGNLIAESKADGTFDFEYLYMGGSRLARVEVGSGTLTHYLNNYLGTPILMTDDTGTVVWEAHYTPFGEASVNANSTVVNNFRFPGQYFDQETGLHYNWHRYYDPKTGRYLTPDPIGLRGGINLYTYTANNPINSLDPFGLDDIYIWDFSPGPEVFIKPIGYMYDMRYKFNQEYQRRIEFCNELYNAEDECRLNQSNYNTCVEFYDIFRHYSKNFGFWHSMFNSWFWKADENLERLKNKLRPVEYDIFYYWDGKRYRPKNDID